MLSKGLARKRPYDMRTANTLAREARGRRPSTVSYLYSPARNARDHASANYRTTPERGLEAEA